jgi:hypothetical protein
MSTDFLFEISFYESDYFDILSYHQIDPKLLRAENLFPFSPSSGALSCCSHFSCIEKSERSASQECVMEND